jgi:HAE1 family hydrophobic/amphiphilic exporter-1
MIASTCLAVLFVPAFFVVLQRWQEGRKPPATPAPAAQEPPRGPR